jgi:colicin import membrane protein
MADAWGGSWGSAWGISWNGAGTAQAQRTAGGPDQPRRRKRDDRALIEAIRADVLKRRAKEREERAEAEREVKRLAKIEAAKEKAAAEAKAKADEAARAGAQAALLAKHHNEQTALRAKHFKAEAMRLAALERQRAITDALRARELFLQREEEDFLILMD